MLEKVSATRHRDDGAGPDPRAGLSEGRLALVHRYMIDAEEAKERARAEGEKNAARAHANAWATAVAAENQTVEETSNGNGADN